MADAVIPFTNNALVQMYQDGPCPACRRGALDCFNVSQDGNGITFNCSVCGIYLNFNHPIPEPIAADQVVRQMKADLLNMRDDLNAVNEQLRDLSGKHTELVSTVWTFTGGK